MEKEQGYSVEITPEGETYYLELLAHLFETHSFENASRKGDEILDVASSLKSQPHRGRQEDHLKYLGKTHRFLVYQITSRKAVKVIYFVDEFAKVVYVTDFFPTLMDDGKISERNP